MKVSDDCRNYLNDVTNAYELNRNSHISTERSDSFMGKRDDSVTAEGVRIISNALSSYSSSLIAIRDNLGSYKTSFKNVESQLSDLINEIGKKAEWLISNFTAKIKEYSEAAYREGMDAYKALDSKYETKKQEVENDIKLIEKFENNANQAQQATFVDYSETPPLTILGTYNGHDESYWNKRATVWGTQVKTKIEDDIYKTVDQITKEYIEENREQHEIGK